MVFKDVSRVEIVELLRRWQADESLRGLSQVTGLCRSTVQKYIIMM